MYERGEHISFANCGLPYYIGETITNRDKLLIQSPKAMKDRFGIDVRIQTEVTAIDRQAKKVIARNLFTGVVQEQPYDFLIMSPGAKPIVPDGIKSYVDSTKPKHVTIIGGGFIGIEMAENLRHRGIEVSVIERNPQV